MMNLHCDKIEKKYKDRGMNKKMIGELMKEILKFRDRRDWAQFHDSNNLAKAFCIN